LIGPILLYVLFLAEQIKVMGFLSFFFPYKNGHAATDSCEKKEALNYHLFGK
jgi:hypothetical protein